MAGLSVNTMAMENLLGELNGANKVVIEVWEYDRDSKAVVGISLPNGDVALSRKSGDLVRASGSDPAV